MVKKSKTDVINPTWENGNLRSLSLSEADGITGGSPFSLEVFRFMGMAFEYMNQASINGAPQEATFKHSG